MRMLLDGKNQVLLEVRMIQLGHTSAKNTGLNPPQTMTVFNVAAEAQSIFSQNQALIQQIISSGLAAPGDFLAILGILAASGQVSNSIFSSGIATFGGSLTNCGTTTYSCTGAATTFAVAPGTFSANLSLNSSDTRELDDLQLRLGDGETATMKSGTKYPIQTSSFSSIGSSALSSIAGLSGAGTSSSLQSLLASYSSSIPNIPQVEYQDLGLTLKAMPKVMRGQDVALTIDLKISALAGSSVNGNPILNNRSWSGVVTVKQDEAVVVISELDKSQSRAVSGVPGISEVPGLNDLTGNDDQKNYASLLIVITPHVVRGTQAAGHSPIEAAATEAAPARAGRAACRLDADAVRDAYRRWAGVYDALRRGLALARRRAVALPTACQVAACLRSVSAPASRCLATCRKSASPASICRPTCWPRRASGWRSSAFATSSRCARWMPRRPISLTPASISRWRCSSPPSCPALAAAGRDAPRGAPRRTILFVGHFAAKAGPRWWVERPMAPASRALGCIRFLHGRTVRPPTRPGGSGAGSAVRHFHPGAAGELGLRASGPGRGGSLEPAACRHPLQATRPGLGKIRGGARSGVAKIRVGSNSGLPKSRWG